MTEAFLQYIWKMKLYDTSGMQTTTGENILIIHCGEQNKNSGPDFFNARIKIDDTVWAGNVELHIKASGWNLHNHHRDKAYDNVILHVVYENDCIHSYVPVLELKNKIAKELCNKYAFMMQTASWIPCEKHLRNTSGLVISNWLTRLLSERLEQKALNIEQRLMLNKSDWEETCYQLIARNFGTNINSEPFERVARSIPFNIILKHIDKPIQIEALLFGQAGFLENRYKELYPNQLQAEYKFLQKKYELSPIRSHEWKFAGIRPANFPTIRMSQFANFIWKNNKIFAKIIETKEIDNIKKLFKVKAAEYWKEHYHFKSPAKVKSNSLGKETVNLILINTVVPLIYLFGIKTGNEKFIVRSIDILESLASENNSIISKWTTTGIISQHAGNSQALLQLKKEYCDKKRCLDCAIGHQVLKSK